jgi:hypothetical protein
MLGIQQVHKNVFARHACDGGCCNAEVCGGKGAILDGKWMKSDDDDDQKSVKIAKSATKMEGQKLDVECVKEATCAPYGHVGEV